jgi:membrane-associated phospholipid phosphatase
MNHNNRHIYPFDKLIIGYCLMMMILIVIFGQPVSEYTGSLLFYATMGAVTAFIVRYLDESDSLSRFFRLLYPAIMFTFFYTATGGTIFLLFDRFLDPQLTGFEQSIFGTDPSLYFDKHLLNVWLNEFFSAAYFSYYLMIPLLLIVLFVKKRYDSIKQFLTTACVAFFTSYSMFFLYPIEGPRWHFAGQYLNQIQGPIFRPLVNLVIEKGAVHGGCMPSSHVGMALVVLVYAFRFNKKLGWFLVPINIGLAIGTVWGRFHYVSDVFVGAAIGVTAIFIVDRYYKRCVQTKTTEEVNSELRIEHVS